MSYLLVNTVLQLMQEMPATYLLVNTVLQLMQEMPAT